MIATEEEVAELFEACDKEDKALGTLARFLVGTGARLSDALAVTWQDVDEKAGDVAIRGQKTRWPLRVATLSPAREAIRRAAKVKNVSGRVFWQFEHRMSMRTQWVHARANFPESLQGMRCGERGMYWRFRKGEGAVWRPVRYRPAGYVRRITPKA